MDRFTYVTGTVGGNMAVGDLSDKIKTMRRLRGEQVYPVVTLADTHMKTRFGGRQRPHFKIARWVQLGGNGTALPAPPAPQASQAPLLAGRSVKEPDLKEELNDEIKTKPSGVREKRGRPSRTGGLSFSYRPFSDHPPPSFQMSIFARLASRYIVPAAAAGSGGLRLAFDIEANGLLDAATKVHCIVIADLDSDRSMHTAPSRFPPRSRIWRAPTTWSATTSSATICRLLRRLHDWAPTPGCTVVDTLVASRLILPHIGDLDDQAAAMGDPSLGKAARPLQPRSLGRAARHPKIGADIEDWSVWTPEMQARCVGDVAICKALWRFLQPDGYSRRPWSLSTASRRSASGSPLTACPSIAPPPSELRQQWTARRAELAGAAAAAISRKQT